MSESVLVVELGLNATNDDILEQMRLMKDRRETGAYRNIVCIMRGFDADPRELYEVPEVRAFCRRLVSLGFISALDMFTTLPESGTSDLCRAGLGAFEVWMTAEGRMKQESELTRELMDEFQRAVGESNTVCD